MYIHVKNKDFSQIAPLKTEKFSLCDLLTFALFYKKAMADWMFFKDLSQSWQHWSVVNISFALFYDFLSLVSDSEQGGHSL